MRVKIDKSQGTLRLLHNGTPLILPSGWCLRCNEQDNASFGFGECPVCGGAVQVESLRQQIDDLERELELANDQVEELDKKLEAIQEEKDVIHAS